MTKIVNMHEAKTHLSRLVEQVLEGEEIILAKAGKPLVRLTTLPEQGGLEGRGALRKAIKNPAQISGVESLFEPMSAEELAEWYDNPIEPDV